jgi:hypothetical protein
MKRLATLTCPVQSINQVLWKCGSYRIIYLLDSPLDHTTEIRYLDDDTDYSCCVTY